MSKKGNWKDNGKIRFWFRGAPYEVGRKAVVNNGRHAKLVVFPRGVKQVVAVRLEKNGNCAWNAFRIKLPKAKMKKLPKAATLNTVSYQSTEKRPE